MKHYIECPYSEKEDAKTLGARWDKEAKKWYYTDEQDPSLFSRWSGQPAEPLEQVYLLDVIAAHRSVCWYPSAGSDFRLLGYLTKYNLEGFDEDKRPSPLPDLFILTDYSAEKYVNYADQLLCPRRSDFDKLAKGTIRPGDVLFEQYRTLLRVKSVKAIKPLGIGCTEELINRQTSELYGQGFLMRVEVNCNMDGERVRYQCDTVYLFAENTSFAADFLFKNKVRIDWIVKIRYGGGFGGSQDTDGLWLAELAGALGTKYFISSPGLSRSSPFGGDEQALEIMRKVYGGDLPKVKFVSFASTEWYDKQIAVWYKTAERNDTDE